MSRGGRSAGTSERPEPRGRCAGPVVTRVSMRLAGLPPRCSRSGSQRGSRYGPPARAVVVNRLVPVAVVTYAGGGAMAALPTATPRNTASSFASWSGPADEPGLSLVSPPAEPEPQSRPPALPVPGSPLRPRATLVPLADNPVTDLSGRGANRSQPWFLGAMATVAHRPLRDPRVHQDRAGETPRGPGFRRFAPDQAACGVFLTQVLAGPEVTRCELCREISSQAEPEDRRGPMT